MNTLLVKLKITVLAILIPAILSLGGCLRSDEAIDLVKSKEMSSELHKGQAIGTYYPSLHSKEDKHEWKSKKITENIHVVSYTNLSGSGWFWEANFETRSVVFINDNVILGEKYGISDMKYDNQFTLESVVSEEVNVDEPGYYEPGIRYTIIAKIKNNSGHRITSAEVSAEFAVAYSEKKYVLLRAKGEDLGISTINPWKKDEIRKVKLQMPAYESALRNYDPTKAIVILSMYASDPVGYEYRGAFLKRDILPLFSKIKEN